MNADPDAEPHRVAARQPHRQQGPDERADAGDLHHDRLVGVWATHPGAVGPFAIRLIENGVGQRVANVALVLVDRATTGRAYRTRHAETLLALHLP